MLLGGSWEVLLLMAAYLVVSMSKVRQSHASLQWATLSDLSGIDHAAKLRALVGLSQSRRVFGG